MNWKTVCSPLVKGGLGIQDLQRFGRALRLRWLWLAWSQPNRPWKGFPTPCDQGDNQLFASNTRVTIGDGKTTKFWTCNWLGITPLSHSFPTLFKHSRRKSRTVAEALLNDQWISDLQHGNWEHIVTEVVSLARKIREQDQILTGQQADTISWRGNGNGIYSTASAYKIQFNGTPSTDMKSTIWKVWAPGKIKIFSWLLHLDRLWCNDRLQRRGWPNSYFCHFCRRNLETSVHLFWNCQVSQAVWTEVAKWRGCASLAPQGREQTRTTSTIRRIISSTGREDKKGVRSMIMATTRELWCARNNCIFRDKNVEPTDIIRAIRENMEQWRLAGAKAIEPPFGDLVVR